MIYVIQVGTGKEEEIVSRIKQLVSCEIYGDVFVVKREIKKKYKGSWKNAGDVLFPGYIFSECVDIDALYMELKKIDGLTNVLGYGDELVAISSQEEDWIKKISGKDRVVYESSGIIEGDRLRVVTGPMIGLEGCVKRIDRHKRIAVVEQEMFGRVVEITLGLEVMIRIEGEDCSSANPEH